MNPYSLVIKIIVKNVDLHVNLLTDKFYALYASTFELFCKIKYQLSTVKIHFKHFRLLLKYKI